MSQSFIQAWSSPNSTCKIPAVPSRTRINKTKTLFSWTLDRRTKLTIQQFGSVSHKRWRRLAVAHSWHSTTLLRRASLAGVDTGLFSQRASQSWCANWSSWWLWWCNIKWFGIKVQKWTSWPSQSVRHRWPSAFCLHWKGSLASTQY